MSAAPEQGQDLVAVACVVEGSFVLASEWPRVLTEYISPLLKRLHDLHHNHQFRLAFVTYGAANTQPSPLLEKRFFSNISLVTKELRDDPSKFGIGKTSCGGSRGLSALEGLVAAIELFDIMISINSSVSPQKDNRSIVFHLLHIASSPPDNAQRPQYNTLQHLDSVTWDTMPTELKKRRINLSLISLRKIQQFQDLQLSAAGSTAQSPWFPVQPQHFLSLSGFPAPLKTTSKRPTDAPLADRNLEAKRQKVASNDPNHRVPSGSPALSAAHTPASQRPTRPPSAQPPQTPAVNPPPQLTAAQPPSASHPPPGNPAHAVPPSPTPAASQPALPHPPFFNPAMLDQAVTPAGLTSRQLMERLKQLEAEVKTLGVRMDAAQQQGQTALVVELQKVRADKSRVGLQIKQVITNHLRNMQANYNPATMANTDGTRPVQSAVQNDNQPGVGVPGPSGDKSASGALDDHKMQLSDAQSITQFWQSRGGTVNVSPSGTHQQGTNQTMPVPPEFAAQMQKLVDKQGIRPQSFGLVPQPSSTAPQDVSPNPGATSSQATQPQQQPVWHGTFSWVAPETTQGAREMQVQVIALPVPQPSGNLLAHTWPTNMTLKFSKEPLQDPQELQTWVKGHQPSLVRLTTSPRANDQASNNQSFASLIKLMGDRHIYAYTGWPLPNANYSDNMVIFPVNTNFLGAVFPTTGLPNLPGRGNTLEPVKPPADLRGVLSSLNLPPVVVAQLQGLDPAKQKELILQFVRRAQLHRQQQHQQMPPQPTLPVQEMGTMGTPNVNVTAAGNMGMNNFPPNAPGATRPMASGVHGNGGRTVNMEMFQSFMQRNADGSSSQGTNPG